MKNLRNSLIFLISLILSLNCEKSLGSHGVVADLTYRHVASNTYEFKLVFYRDCNGSPAAAPVNIALLAKSTSLGITNRTAGTLFLLPFANNGTQPPNLYNCSSNVLCVEEYTYSGTVNLNAVNPANPLANDWIFYYELCCRPNGGISLNFDNVTIGNLYCEAGLNNLDFPGGNDAPFWHDRYPSRPGHTLDTIVKYPVKTICSNRWIDFEEHVTEYEGDSIHYEFIYPVGVSSTVGYNPGYSLLNPLPTVYPPGFTIDSSSGLIHFNTYVPVNGDDKFLVTIKATEFRKLSGVAIQIGYVIRDLAIVVTPAANCPGENIALVETPIHLSCPDTVISISTTQNFLCSTADQDASFVDLTDSASGTPVAINSVETPCSIYMISKKFNIHTALPLDYGTYYLTLKKGTDTNTIISECGAMVPEYRDTLKIIVDSLSQAAMLGHKDMSGNRLSYLNAECGQMSIEVEFDAPVRCISIDPLGGDFLVFDSTASIPIVLPIVSAFPNPCVSGMTQKVTLTLSSAIKSGNYALFLLKGADGNTITNACGVATPATSIAIKSPELTADLGPDLVYCKDSSFQALLEAPAGFASYSWNNGWNARQLFINTKGTYIVTVNNGLDCLVSDTVIVREIDCATGIEAIAAESFEVYPNPANEKIYFLNNGADRFIGISMRNVNGEEIYHSQKMIKSNEQVQIDVSTFAAGVYFVQLNTGGQLVKTQKIVIGR